MNPVSPPAQVTDAFWGHIPGWAWPILVAGTVAFFIWQAIQAYEGFAKIFGPIGRKLYDRKTTQAAKRAGLQHWELADLRRQVEFLGEAIEDLRDRDEMSWAFVLSDQEWHRNYEFMCAERGAVPMPRVSFMEFRTKWLKERTPAKPPTTLHDS